MSFDTQYLCRWPENDEFELCVKAWMAYYLAADSIDGHIPPGHPEQKRLGAIAVRAGIMAMQEVIPGATLFGLHMFKCWREARLEALRRIEKGVPR